MLNDIQLLSSNITAGNEIHNIIAEITFHAVGDLFMLIFITIAISPFMLLTRSSPLIPFHNELKFLAI